MDHADLVQVIRSVIENHPEPGESDRPEDYDLEAIAAEARGQTRREGVDELDPETYWLIVKKHAEP
ncbi:hypothetical protein BH708_06035 [Brachybacterium sp. P6-10-X1]|uniref:hypothetical protein n=1 Tax=Brachybacterium sp. P6-10-X1 TaxID=1903186 RepID=UPI000971BF51|nr:hypothetical protein [Brachybacterium sp. P6-10-X1]APX32352.1 hypothetical protein BH708_06035 [Brachybacterium sp. P6-10-X1]